MNTDSKTFKRQTRLIAYIETTIMNRPLDVDEINMVNEVIWNFENCTK